MTEPLYILTRTSGRPEFFGRCRSSIKALNWPGPVIHLVHTDDPRDIYVEGDIIVRGETLGPSFGSGFYNLYNNRLLKALPREPGWVHFMDDDDEYIGPDALAWLPDGNRDALHVCKTRRIGVSKHADIFPNLWKKQKTFQTECFALWSEIARKFEWWGERGGDHNYTHKITRKHPIIWHDHLATQTQTGKGNGSCLDIKGVPTDKRGAFPEDTIINFKMFATVRNRKQASLISIPLWEAEALERHELGRVTFKGVSVKDTHA